MPGYVGHERTVGTSAADTNKTTSAGGGAAGANDGTPRRCKHITIAYSAAPTQTGVQVTLNSGAGAGYDTLLFQGSANERYTFIEFEGEGLLLLGDDSIDVLAPAAGGVITSSVAIVCVGAN